MIKEKCMELDQLHAPHNCRWIPLGSIGGILFTVSGAPYSKLQVSPPGNALAFDSLVIRVCT